MQLHIRRYGDLAKPPIVFVAGFGDHGGMFESLAETTLVDRFSIVAVDLPGTGRSEPIEGDLTLEAAASLVGEIAAEHEAVVLVGHSIGSIIASLAARQSDGRIGIVLSIEGNLTAADAYFSGSAAAYDIPDDFHREFLARLGEMSIGNQTLRRYRDQIALADPQSIWELGADTHRWSAENHPGEVLMSSAVDVWYLFNPENTPAESLDWLGANAIRTIRLDGASHWKAVDQPELMAEKLLEALDSTGTVALR